jgi:hypothetical protein
MFKAAKVNCIRFISFIDFYFKMYAAVSVSSGQQYMGRRQRRLEHWWTKWRQTCPIATLSITNITWTALGLNMNFCENLIFNCPSYGTAYKMIHKYKTHCFIHFLQNKYRPTTNYSFSLLHDLCGIIR